METTTGNVEKVNHPSHYNQVGTETIDVIQSFCSASEFEGFLKGNIIKYLHRYHFKNGIEDLNKAKWYLEKLIEVNS